MNKKKIPGMNATPILQYSQGITFLQDLIYGHSVAVATLHGNLERAIIIANDTIDRFANRSRHGIILTDKDIRACHADFYIVISPQNAAETNAIVANYFGKQPDCALLFSGKKELEKLLLNNRKELSDGLYDAVIAFDLEER